MARYIVEIKGELPSFGALKDAQPEQSITRALMELCAKVCDTLCKYHAKADDGLIDEDDLIDTYCTVCPLNRIG